MSNLPGRMALAAAWALALLPLSGCLEGFGTQSAGPTAELDASTHSPWAGEPVTFDGRRSHADGAPITLWRFDFGDGDVVEVRSIDEARLQHEYDRPGPYLATLTVESDSGGQTERGTTTLALGVGERRDLQATLVADPVGLEASSNLTVPFDVGDAAASFRVGLDVSAGVGPSRLQARVLDPNGAELDGTRVALEAGGQDRIVLEGLLGRSGEHRLELRSENGSVDVSGDLQVLYRPPG